jgi:hypothetical protein
MRRILMVLFFAAVFSAMNAHGQTPEKLAAAWDAEHISQIQPSDVRHGDLKKYLDKLKSSGIKVEEVGRSGANREIYRVEWGTGPLKVFMWSQMHGDEPTATSALMDMFAYFQKHRNEPWIKKIGETMTIRAVPMLNPDGQELYQRRNLQGIDINRDATDLKTPEARLLKQLRDSWFPEIGFNLHNQGALTSVSRTPKQAAISLLVVYGDAAKTTSFGHERNQRVASAMVAALQKFIPGHIGRYSDEWTPNAFGDNFSAWGTPTILIETGALHGHDELYLVKMNFIAITTALNSVATGSERGQDPLLYVNLPENASGVLANYVFRRANLVTLDPTPSPTPSPAAPAATVTPTASPTPALPAATISVADISANKERRRASFIAPVRIRSIDPFTSVRGLEEYDASNFYVRQRFSSAKAGELAEFYFYKKNRPIDWAAQDFDKQYQPDAVFSSGRFIKGVELFSKK